MTSVNNSNIAHIAHIIEDDINSTVVAMEIGISTGSADNSDSISGDEKDFSSMGA